MAEYGSMFAVSGLAAILFFGGWNGPLPITEWLGLDTTSNPLPHYFGNLLGMCNFIGKCVFGVTFMMWVRWTLPRLRIDQVMTTCLKYCTPIAAAMFLGAVVWSYAFPAGWIIKSSYPLGTIAESWLAQEYRAAKAKPPAETHPPTEPVPAGDGEATAPVEVGSRDSGAGSDRVVAAGRAAGKAGTP
jgi:NADH-quinone oxidoreductase subunit H